MNAMLNLRYYYLFSYSYYIISLIFVIVFISNVHYLLKALSYKHKDNKDFMFRAGAIVSIIGLVLPLLNLGLEENNSYFKLQTFSAFVGPDVRFDNYGYSAVGLDGDNTATYCRYLYKNKLGYYNLKYTNQVQTTGFFYANNNIQSPFDINAHYWLPQVTHVLLDSKEGTTFSFECEVEDDQIGTYMRFFIDDVMIDKTIEDNHFTFTYEGLNKNEIYGIRVEIGKIHPNPDASDWRQQGYRIYKMEIN